MTAVKRVQTEYSKNHSLVFVENILKIHPKMTLIDLCNRLSTIFDKCQDILQRKPILNKVTQEWD